MGGVQRTRLSQLRRFSAGLENNASSDAFLGCEFYQTVIVKDTRVTYKQEVIAQNERVRALRYNPKFPSKLNVVDVKFKCDTAQWARDFTVSSPKRRGTRILDDQLLNCLDNVFWHAMEAEAPESANALTGARLLRILTCKTGKIVYLRDSLKLYTCPCLSSVSSV